jgi:hypothetical protein
MASLSVLSRLAGRRVRGVLLTGQQSISSSFPSMGISGSVERMVTRILLEVKDFAQLNATISGLDFTY